MVHTVTEPGEQRAHPIRGVVRAMARSGPGGTISFAEADLARIWEALEGHLEADSLVDAVETLLVEAHTLEMEHGSPEAAEQIAELCERPEVLTALRQLNARPKRTEPAATEPDGPVKAGSLNFPKRL